MKKTDPLTEKEIADLRWEIRPRNKLVKAAPAAILALWMILSGSQILKLKKRVADLEANLPKIEQQTTTSVSNEVFHVEN